MTYEPQNAALAGKVRFSAVANTTYLPNNSRGLDPRRDTALPSIEHPQVSATSSRNRAVSGNHPVLPSINDRRVAMEKDETERRVGDIEFLDLTEEPQHLTKRRRIYESDMEVSSMPRTRVLTPNECLQQREHEYISLLSPTDKHSQPNKSDPLSPLRYQGSYSNDRVSSSIPTYRDRQGFSSPGALMQVDGQQVARGSARQPSNLNHFRSREILYPLEASSRAVDGYIPTPLRSALPAGAGPVDRRIQEYRAFRARERQERELLSSPNRGRSTLRENGDITDGSVQSNDGRLREPQEVSSSRRLDNHQLPLRRLSQNFDAIHDGVTLSRDGGDRIVRERIVEGNHVVRRRSASPVQNSVTRLSYMSPLANDHSQRPHEVTARNHTPVDYGQVLRRGPLIEPRLVSSARR